MKSRYKRKAWYLDEDILIEGHTDKRGFHPMHGIQCGFGLVIFTKKMIGKEIFFDLEDARKVLGNVDVVVLANDKEDTRCVSFTIEELLKLGEERNKIELAKPLF